MPTKLPRYQITVNPQNIELLEDVHKYLGMSKSKLFNEIIEKIKPALLIQIDALKKIEELKDNNLLDKFDYDEYMKEALGNGNNLLNQAKTELQNIEKSLKSKGN